MKSLLTSLFLGGLLPLHAEQATESKSIPFDQLGAEAQKRYAGDGIGITPTADGARLKAVMQDLEAVATAEGLWLTSTADEDLGKPNRFRVKATEVYRQDGAPFRLMENGTVRATKDAAMFLRPGMIEEYGVSTDGVRQDFVLPQRPAGGGDLRVTLAVSGARVDPAGYGVKLTVAATGREIAYSRLRVTDALGKELTARMEAEATDRIQISVEDAAAVYPVRIDPTFSDADWVSLNPDFAGVNGNVNALVVDGSGNLIVGGSFSAIGGVPANHIAKWNGSAWLPLDTGMNGNVLALAVSGGDLYAGGYFTTAGGVSASRIAKWNGSAWSPLGAGVSTLVNTLVVSGSDLYAGGVFGTAGGVTVNNIAKWNGSVWSALGSGMNGNVLALAVSGGDLYAGGVFTTAGGVSASRIAKWNGSVWSALGSGMDSNVEALAVSGSDLYAGGNFSTAGGVSASRIAKWNGSAWSALGTGVSGTVYALAVSGSDLYAGGNFSTAGGVSANSIAKWNGSVWSALGSGMTGDVYALAVSIGDLYTGGNFTTAGGVSANSIAKWNGSTWTSMTVSTSGINGNVLALAVSGGDLYAGGFFTRAGGVSASRIAKWNGSAWSALGSGMDGTVYALAMSGGDLYAGGQFTTAGGVSASCIAKWNGSVWSALGSGVDNIVYALAVSGSDLYAGGQFTNAGGVSASRIAKWNGGAWSALGTGMNGNVLALAVSGSDLYAGGDFTTAGGSSRSRIAKWNGSVWSALGSGMNGNVLALAVSGGDLYAGGDFTTAGGASRSRIARWNGSAWSALGTGINGDVLALAVNGSNQLFVGGTFSAAGTTYSPSIVQGNIQTYLTEDPILTSPATNTVSGSPISVNFSLPETALPGSVSLAFTGAVTRVLMLASSQETVGTHNFSFNPANPTASPQILSGSAIPDGNYMVTLSYQDSLGNPAAMASSTNVTLNTPTQTPTLTSPEANVVVGSSVSVSFSLPEAALPGSVKLSFGATILTLAATEETAGSHSFTFDPANPTASPQIASGSGIPDGTYTVTLSYRDLVGNLAASAVSTNVTLDTVTLTPTLSSPAANTELQSPVSVSFSLPEAAQTGSVKLSFGATILTLAATEETAGTHGFAFDPANPTASPQIASGSAIPDGTYTVTLSYQDALGNSAAAAFASNVTLDTVTLTPTLTSPAANAMIDNTVNVSFSLPETALPGSVTLNFGATVLTLAASEESTGPHSFTFNPANPTASPQIASGGAIPDGTYTVTLSYRDAVGNTPATAVAGNVVLDRATLTPVLTAPATNGSTTNPIAVSFNLPEAAKPGSLKLIWAGPLTMTFTLAAIHESSGAHNFTFTHSNLTSNPNFASVTGGTFLPLGTYSVTLSYQDALDHPAAAAVATNFLVDYVTVAPTLTTPAANTAYASPIPIQFTLPEAALPGSVRLIFYSGGAGAPLGRLNLAGSMESAGTHAFSLNPANLLASPEVASAVNNVGSPITAIADRTALVELSYQDTMGNSIASHSRSNVTIDTTAPTGGTMTISPASPVSAGAAVTVNFASWADGRTPLGYAVLVDDVIVSAQGATASRNITAPATPGVHVLKGRIFDSLGNISEVTQNFTVISALEAWRQTHFGSTANTGHAADLFDFDKDGLVNLIEFAFGLNPTLPDAHLMPQAQRVGSELVISFTPPANVSGITYGAQSSETMAAEDWQPVPDTGTGPVKEFKITVGAKSKDFVRLTVTGQAEEIAN